MIVPETRSTIGLLEVWVSGGCGYQQMDLALALTSALTLACKGPCTVLPPWRSAQYLTIEWNGFDEGRISICRGHVHSSTDITLPNFIADMTAVRFHGRGDIRLDQLQEPQCGKGEVKVP